MTPAQTLQLLGIGVPAVVSIASAFIAARYAVRARLAEQQAARLLALEDRTAERKWETYEPFVEALGAVLVPSQRDAAMKTMEKVMVDFQTFVTSWGSERSRQLVLSIPPRVEP